jgi:hypothetical protein
MRDIGMRLAMMLAIAAALVVNPGVAEAAGIPYTVEPFDFDGIGGMSMSALTACTMTQDQQPSPTLRCTPATQCSDAASDRR